MKKLFENWNKYLNEETIEESFKIRAYYNIPTEDWMAMSGTEKKQIRAKYEQEMAQKASQDAQPAGGQESGDPTVNFIRQLVKMGIYDSLNTGLSAEDLMGNYKAALDANNLPRS